MVVPTETDESESFSPEGHCLMRKFAVEGDNRVLDCLNIASQHSSCRTEPWNGTIEGVEITGVLTVIVEEGLPVLVVPDASDVAVALVIPVDVQPALDVPAQLDGCAHDRFIKVSKFLHVNQDELCQIQQAPGAPRKHWNAHVCCTGDQA